MLTRLRSTWLAGGGAVLLVLSLTGLAAGAALVADTADTADTVVEPTELVEGTTDTTLTFEDLDGNGVDDDCQDAEVTADPEAATAAFDEADLDDDGTISVSEAAQSEWTGGANCNHGGYVSSVARGTDDACDEADAPDEEAAETAEEDADEDEATEDVDEDDAGEASTEDETEEPAAATCDEEQAETEETSAECEAPAEEPAAEEETPLDTAPNAHGKAVSDVATSPAVGGKNCNHGGAVSEAAKKDHGDAHGNAAKKAAGQAHGKGHKPQD